MNVQVIDTTLRDGSHAVDESFTPEQVSQICREMEKANLYAMEVGLGTGLGGIAPENGFSTIALLKAARKELKNTKLATLFVPGIGTDEDLKQGAEAGLDIVRIAVLCTKCISAVPFIKTAKEQRLTACVFLMASHLLSPADLAAQCKMLQENGADMICIGDSIGAMIASDVAERVHAVQNVVTIPVGIHTHNHLGLAVSNAVEGVLAGSQYVDGTLEGLGEGSGNGNLQAIVAVCERNGIHTGVDFHVLNQIAEKSVRPLMKAPQELKGCEIAAGFAKEMPDILKSLE